MSVSKEIRTLSERIASLETSISYLNDSIHQLREDLSFHKKNPVYWRVISLLNSAIFAWLSVITYILFKNHSVFSK